MGGFILSEVVKIALDAMGGDNAPHEIVKGAIESLKEIKSDLLLLGDEDKIKNVLKDLNYDESRVEVLHTTEVIENEDKPVKAIKAKGVPTKIVIVNWNRLIYQLMTS